MKGTGISEPLMTENWFGKTYKKMEEIKNDVET
jgi:hypothetical protein